MLAFAIFGVSRAMTTPTGQALVGRFISLQQRPKYMGYLLVGVASAYFVGSSLTNVITDWRLMFALFLLPFAFITLLLAFKGIPPTPKTHSSQQYSHAFKDVLFNKSALACLTGNILYKMPANGVMLSLGSSFYRQTFMVDKAFMSAVFICVILFERQL